MYGASLTLRCRRYTPKVSLLDTVGVYLARVAIEERNVVICYLSQKNPMTRLLLLILCLFLLTACDIFGGGNPPARQLVKAPPDKQIYTLPEAGISDFDTLDPALAHDDPSIRAVQMLFTGLVQFDDPLQFLPPLAPP